MLLQILQLFEERKTISLRDLSLHYKIDSSAIQAILDELVKKGKISRNHLECESCCTGCGYCSYANVKDVYKLI